MKKGGDISSEKGLEIISEKVRDYGTDPNHLGRMSRPDGYARITGPCGDTDEIFLRVRIGKIEEAKFITDGCIFSRAACNAAAHLAIGKELHECLVIDQQSIMNHLGDLPASHAHCALLASETLSTAVKNYVLDHTRSAYRCTKPLKSSLKKRFTHSEQSSGKITNKDFSKIL
jgi:nitrogen fixation protein NifU and related proteins